MVSSRHCPVGARNGHSRHRGLPRLAAGRAFLPWESPVAFAFVTRCASFAIREELLVVLVIPEDILTVIPAIVAYRSRRWAAPATNRRIEDYCRTNTMASAVAPGATESGFAFAQFVPGALAFNVELLGQRDLQTFAFVQEVPGFKADFNRVHFDRLYAQPQIRRVDQATLRRELEALPPTASAPPHTPGI
jgi:hypothetical protein